MSRKPVSTFEASVDIVCKNSTCAHQFMVSPNTLRKKQPIICPKCRFPNEFTDDEVLERLSRNVERLKEAHRRLTGERGLA
jgi:hypothetical protein